MFRQPQDDLLHCVRILRPQRSQQASCSYPSGAVDDAREAFNQSGRTDGRASLMLAEAVFKNWEHLTGRGTKCQMDFPTSSLINNHLLEATRLDPSLAEEKKAVARMVVENLYIMGSTEDEDRNREEIQTRLERDRRRLARLKLPKCPAQVSDTWRAATGLPLPACTVTSQLVTRKERSA